MFNNPTGLVEPSGMVATLGTWGIIVTLEDIEGVFRFLDQNGNQTIELTEFAQGVIFPDYSQEGVIAKKEDAEREEESNRLLLVKEASSLRPGLHAAGGDPSSGAAWKFHVQEVIYKIRDKLERQTCRSQDLARSSFKIFNRQGSFTKGLLRDHLYRLGFTDITEMEIDSIFLNLDKDGTGLIDFGEFIRGILPTEHYDTIGSGHEPTVTADHAARMDGFREEAKGRLQGVSPDWLAWKAR